jgi:hypothetical protein
LRVELTSNTGTTNQQVSGPLAIAATNMLTVADAAWFLCSLGAYVAFFLAGRVLIESTGYASRVAPPIWATGAAAIAARSSILAKRRLRALSWLVVLLSSSVMTVAAMYYTYKVVVQHLLLRQTTDIDVARWMESDETIGRGLSAGFLASLVADIALGLMYYPSEIHVLSGWIHHAVYAAILIWLLEIGWTTSFMA